MPHKVFGFADGENLVLRYEAMVKDGAIPKPDVIHIPGVLVWHPAITHVYLCAITRLGYYQTVIGDQEKLDEVRELISGIQFSFNENSASLGTGRLAPRVFKKERRSSKTKSVDINITVDVLRSVMNGTGDVVLFLSGDGDYLPLIEEVMRHGKQVWLCAFSNGLSSSLKFAADDFFDLDTIFFESSNPSLQPTASGGG